MVRRPVPDTAGTTMKNARGNQRKRKESALDAVRRELNAALDALGDEPVARLAAMVRGARRIFVCGAGWSGLTARCFAQRLRHLGMESWVAGDTVCPPAGTGDLFIAVSCSGRTPTTSVLLDRAATAGCRTLAVAGSRAGRIARRADARILLPRGASRQPGNAVFEQTAFILFEAAVAALAGTLRTSPAEMEGRHANLE